MSGPARHALEAIVVAEMAAAVPEEVARVAEAARQRHGAGTAAILYYGSCRREGYRPGALVDLYLLVDGYATVHASRLMRCLNWLIPPNVYFIEAMAADGTPVRAKYALLSLLQAERLTSVATLNPYFWARFAQPTGLVWARDATVAQRVATILVQSILTTAGATRPLLAGDADAASLWTRALAESYRTELRAEPPGRAPAIVTADLERYRRVTAALAELPPADPAWRARLVWWWRRIQGKGLSLARLAKASFTFAGGADYLAWKIGRHAGVPVEFSPWERRHPLLAAPRVLWRLVRRGAVR